MSFESLGLSSALLKAVAHEGYETPSPIQVKAIPFVLEGRDVLGSAQTGTGKTAAFALPILHLLSGSPAPANKRKRPIRALILSPTRELALQIAESFQAYGRFTGLRHTAVFGGVNQNPQVRDLQRGVDILVATPGRLGDLMNQGYIDLSAVEILVLDEADRMLDMGFLPEVKRLIVKLPAKRQTLFFSATMPEEVQHLADAILSEPERIFLAPTRQETTLVEQSVYFVDKKQKSRALAACLDNPGVSRAIVFTRTKHGADRVVRRLRGYGISADALHGNKSQAARQRALADFKAFRTHVLVATDIASRGLDVDGISHVLNYDMPPDPETYVHRIGRTGRAGATGIAISLCDSEERKDLKAIERFIRKSIAVAKDLDMSKFAADVESDHSSDRDSRRPTRMDRRPARPERRPQRSESRDNSHVRFDERPARSEDRPTRSGEGAERSENRPERRAPKKGRPGRREREALKSGKPLERRPEGERAESRPAQREERPERREPRAERRESPNPYVSKRPAPSRRYDEARPTSKKPQSFEESYNQEFGRSRGADFDEMIFGGTEETPRKPQGYAPRGKSSGGFKPKSFKPGAKKSGGYKSSGSKFGGSSSSGYRPFKKKSGSTR